MGSFDVLAVEALSEASSSGAADPILPKKLELTSTALDGKLPVYQPPGCMQIDDSSSDTISVSIESHIDALEVRVHDVQRKSKLKKSSTSLGSLSTEEEEEVTIG